MVLLVEIAGHVEVREARFEMREPGFEAQRPTTEAWRELSAGCGRSAQAENGRLRGTFPF
jgi:hypothetical protein